MSSSGSSPPRKKTNPTKSASKKGVKSGWTKFSHDWFNDKDFKDWIIKVDEYTFSCKYCNTERTVKHDGVRGPRNHLTTSKHIANAAALNLMQRRPPVNSYFIEADSKEEKAIAVAELAQCFHSVKHHHSYLSLDCSVKMNRKIFSDSAVATKMSLGRTKATAVVGGVLAPYSVELATDLLVSEDNPGQCRPFFSLATDGSSKWQRKIYPHAVRFFDVNKGAILDRILQFEESADGTSEAIFDQLKSTIDVCGLRTEDISAFSSDSASVNFAEKNSVLRLLQDHNENIMPAPCPCHLIHNAGQFAFFQMKPDVEEICRKIYAEFQNATKKEQALKECFEFLDMDYSKCLGMSQVRWLSLRNALERLVKNWHAVRLYFLNLGARKCPRPVWKFIKDQASEPNYSKKFLTESELYLHFTLAVSKLLSDYIQRLESSKLTAISLHTIMTELRSLIQERLNAEFYSDAINTSLTEEDHPDFCGNVVTKFKRQANEVYSRALEYIEERFEFEETPFFFFTCLDIVSYNKLDHKKLMECIRKIKLSNVDFDQMFNEVTILNVHLPMIKQGLRGQEDDLVALWTKVFRETGNRLKNLFRLVSFVLSVPINNAYCERIFSVVLNLWTDERNRLSIDTVKAEVQTFFNYNLTCEEFIQFLQKPAQKDLLNAVKSNQKYIIKNR